MQGPAQTALKIRGAWYDSSKRLLRPRHPEKIAAARRQFHGKVRLARGWTIGLLPASAFSIKALYERDGAVDGEAAGALLRDVAVDGEKIGAVLLILEHAEDEVLIGTLDPVILGEFGRSRGLGMKRLGVIDSCGLESR